VNRRRLPPANVVILASGAIMLIATFLPFYKVPLPDQTVTFDAWDRGLFLIATLPALLGVVMALQIGLEAFGGITMPNRILGLTWDQFHIVLAFQSALLMLTRLAQARPTLVVVTFTLGAGFWLMMICAGGLVVGALMRIAVSRRRPRAI
jgi:hypothetical protein